MKKILIIIFAIISVNPLFSQDIIIKKTGEEVISKVLEITPTDVRFKKSDNFNGPVYSILKSEVSIIKYENGTQDIFNEKQTDTSLVNAPTVDLFDKGRMDAQKYYDGYKGAGTGTFLVGFLSPLVGLIPAIACSSTAPKDKNLNYPKPDLMKNADYKKGYTQKAKKIKQGKVWNNWTITLAINIIATVILSSSQR